MDAPEVILTGEYIPENFLLACHDDQWSLAGLFDFGDVRTGWREYDLLGPSAFMAAGRPGRVRSLFEGFGYARTDVTFALKRRLMALMLLHRHSDPNSHTNSDTYTDSMRTRRMWSNSDPNPNTYSDANSSSQRNPNADGHRRADGNANRDANSYTHTYVVWASLSVI